MSEASTTPSDEAPEGVLVTLQRGLDVLETVAAGNGEVTAKRISRMLGLNLSTTYNLLRTLRSSGYVVRLPGGKFDVGPKSSKLSRSLQLRAGPEPQLSALLGRLHNKTQETAYICGWYHGTIMLQQHLAGVHALSVGHLEIGYTGNLHARASCKAILAFLPEEQVELMFATVDLPRLTPKTRCTYDEILSDLVQVRRQGYALDIEEFAEHISCVSAPFFDAQGNPIGSFTVSVPASRFTASRTKLITDTQEVAAMATNLLRGGHVCVSSLALQTPARPRNRTDRAVPADGGVRAWPSN
ncbi:IclR family transcriptional regulator [Micromonospora sp. NPDC049679]|uniref:IclR family transcriptional regulator n=1 Tax=Micromonospora sp. NPDC049679 TaxID=3155920 RepID=UPI0033EC4CFA